MGTIRYSTEMMQDILASESGQRMIDYVSRIYGESYVGLWLFQIIGTVMDELEQMGQELMQQTTPITATWALDYYEEEYNLPKDSSLSLMQRRNRIVGYKMTRAPFNPQRICDAVANRLGVRNVELEENTGKNQFTVFVRESVERAERAREVIDELKPAHLIYELVVTLLVQANPRIYLAVAANTYQINTVEVQTYG